MLTNFIENGNYSSLEEAYDAIKTRSIERIDTHQYTWAGIAEIVGEDAEQIKNALEENNMSWAVYQFGGSGLPLSHPKIQAALYKLAESGVSGCEKLAKIGLDTITPWENMGLLSEPTLEEVQSAWDFVQLSRAARMRLQQIQNTRLKWDSVGASVRNMIELGQIGHDNVIDTITRLWNN